MVDASGTWITLAWTGTGRSSWGNSSATDSTAPTGTVVSVRMNMPVVLMLVASPAKSPGRPTRDTFTFEG